MNLHNHVFNSNSNAYVKQKMVHKLPCDQNGMVDTVRFCLYNINKHNCAFLNMILKVSNNLVISYIVCFYILCLLLSIGCK